MKIKANLKTFIQCLTYIFILCLSGSFIIAEIISHTPATNNFPFMANLYMAFLKLIPFGLASTIMIYPFLLRKNKKKNL